MTAPREYRRLFRDLERAGVVITGGGGTHYKLRFPNGGLLVVSGSASDQRAVRNVRAQVRAALGGAG